MITKVLKNFLNILELGQQQPLLKQLLGQLQQPPSTSPEICLVVQLQFRQEARPQESPHPAVL